VPIACIHPDYEPVGVYAAAVILDSHPGLGLAWPPETTVSAACAQLIRTWDMVENAAYQSRPVTETPTPSAEALQATGEAIDRLFGRYLARRGKRRWV
jgi:hypothetical protein